MDIPQNYINAFEYTGLQIKNKIGTKNAVFEFYDYVDAKSKNLGHFSPSFITIWLCNPEKFLEKYRMRK